MVNSIVWIEGIIGSGKSTLTKKISEAMNMRTIMEPVETNPYLELFYKDPKRWAFPMQIELLHRRYAMQKLAAFESLGECGYKGAILDRGLPGDRVFAKLHMLCGNMSEIEWKTYDRAYNIMACSLTPPSLLVFLDVDPRVALERVHARNRSAENGLPLQYLQDLQKGYYDLLVEIESGVHAWSRGMRVVKVPWNIDHQSEEKILDLIKNYRYL